MLRIHVHYTRRHHTRTYADLSVLSHGRLRVVLRPPGNTKNRLANFLEGKILFKCDFVSVENGGCFQRLNFASYAYEALYISENSINLKKIDEVWKGFFLSLNLG